MTYFDFGEIIKSDTEFVLFGVPWDYLTSTDLPNSAIAPAEIRKITKNLALTTEMGSVISDFKLVDIGNVAIVNNKVERNIKEIEKFVNQIYDQNPEIIPIMIGGDHFCSYPVFKAVGNNFKNKKKLGIILFDAHLDLYNEWDKGVYSHATISHRIYDLEYINKNNILIIGTRDIDIPELEKAKEEEIEYLNAFELNEYGLDRYITNIVNFFQKSNIESLYISIDIDALDPSISPGTGYAIPGGMNYRELWTILRRISESFNIIGFDLVEVAPNLDLPNHITSILGAKLIIELVSFIKNNKSE